MGKTKIDSKKPQLNSDLFSTLHVSYHKVTFFFIQVTGIKKINNGHLKFKFYFPKKVDIKNSLGPQWNHAGVFFGRKHIYLKKQQDKSWRFQEFAVDSSYIYDFSLILVDYCSHPLCIRETAPQNGNVMNYGIAASRTGRVCDWNADATEGWTLDRRWRGPLEVRNETWWHSLYGLYK